MFKKNIQRISIILSILVVLFCSSAFVFADGGSLYLSTKNASVAQGTKFRIAVAVETTDASGLASFGFEMSYNDAVFTYEEADTVIINNTPDGDFSKSVAPSQPVKIFWNAGISSLPLNGRTSLVYVYFTAKNIGSGTFLAKSTGDFSDQNAIEIAIANSSGISVTVTPPVVLSSNNDLKSLNVDPGTLSPAFAAGTLKYTMPVAEGLSKITVSAAPADAKASVTITGNTKLVDGPNTIKITVTAENGSKKTYTIIATRVGPTPTPAATPTPAVTVTLPGGLYTVLDLPLDMVPPAGFAPTTITLSGQTVQVFQSTLGELNLFYLAAADGTTGLYYYNSVSKTYLPFVVMTIPAQLFTVLTPDSGVTIPLGFTETTLLLNGQSVIAWQRDTATPTPAATTANVTTSGTTASQSSTSVTTTASTSTSPAANSEYLLYLMDSGGAKNFYLYDAITLALSQYQSEVTIETTATTTSAETTETTETTATGGNPIGKDFNIWQLFSLALGLICLVLIGMVIWLVVRGPGSERREKLPPVQKPPIRRID